MIKKLLKICKSLYLWLRNYISSVFVLLQNESLIEAARKGDLSGVEDALLRGANINVIFLVCLFNLFYKRI